MGDFINNLIPYGTDMTPYYIGIAFIFWIVGLIIVAKSMGGDDSDGFIFFSMMWAVLSAVWFVLVMYAIFAIPIIIIWKLFGGKKDGNI
jgi:hypothetical protein